MASTPSGPGAKPRYPNSRGAPLQLAAGLHATRCCSSVAGPARSDVSDSALRQKISTAPSLTGELDARNWQTDTRTGTDQRTPRRQPEEDVTTTQRDCGKESGRT